MIPANWLALCLAGTLVEGCNNPHTEEDGTLWVSDAAQARTSDAAYTNGLNPADLASFMGKISQVQGYTRNALDPTKSHDTAPSGVTMTTQNHGPQYVKLDAFTRHVFTTDATSIIVEGAMDVPIIGGADIGWNSTGCLVNGVPQGDGAYSASLGGPLLFVYSGLGAGTKTIELIDGPTDRLSGGPPRAAPIVAVHIPAGGSYSVVLPTAPAARVVVHGTSLTVGSLVTAGPSASATYQCTFQRMRANMVASVSGALAGARLTMAGASREKWEDICGANSAANVALDVARCNGTVSNLVIFDDYETNSFAASVTSLAALTTMIGNHVDALHVALPNAKIIFVTATTRFAETVPNSQGWTVPQLRQVEADIAVARPSYCSKVDGPPLVSPGNISAGDGVHLTSAGQAEKEVNLRARFGELGFGY